MTRRRSRAAPAVAAAAAAAAAVPSLLASAAAAASVLGALPPPHAAAAAAAVRLPAAATARQAVDASAVAASWALSNGAAAGCPQTVVIRGGDGDADGGDGDEGGGGGAVTSLSAASLVVDGAACAAGGEVAVLPGTADGVTGPTADVLRAADSGFTFGIVAEPLTCGRWEWPVNTAAYFFGGAAALTVGSGADAVELPAATRFLSVQFPDTTRQSCVYSASTGGDAGGGDGGGGEGGARGEDGDGVTAASPTADADESVCFPATATVDVEARGAVAMADLRLGDRVRVSATTFEPVVLFSHRDAAATGDYVALTTAAGRVLVATVGHLVYTASTAAPDGWALTRAGSVTVGDVLPLVATADGAAAAAAATADGGRVVAVAPATASGLYNPHTPSGALVVDGVRVSAYTTAVPVRVARSLLVPVSAAASCGLLREATAGRFLAGGAPAAAAAARWVAAAWAAVVGRA